MAKINTLNYQTVASWNGSQDLFVVEQPDGTKVATPAMVKQFIQAGDFEATGEVKDGHGNILKDMANSADVNEVIGDLSQTGLTGDSVAEQLDAARVEIAKKRSLTVSSSIIGNAVNVVSATSTNPYITPHEGFVRFDGTTCLCVNTYRMMKSSADADFKGMWLPKGVSIYFADGTPNLAQWFNCSGE